MLTFVCLKAGTGFSSDYVNILRDMVLRNTQEGIISRFVCITDDPAGLDDGIEVLPLPSDLETWWGKLYMFKQGLFPDGERMIFMDLDTIITGRLDEILSYCGVFASLRDFYKPEELASGVMLWEAGRQTIWEQWEAAGKPRHNIGDQWWIGGSVKEPDFLQDIFPGKFVSFKADCQVAPPVSASVVCFHGLPRPHQVKGWVENFWKKGGYSSADFDVVCNTELAKVVDNIKYSSILDIPCLELKPETQRKIILCGGGPSLADSLNEIMQAQYDGELVVGMNGSAQWLQRHGVCPNWLVMIDSRASNMDFITWLPADEYFIASQCSPSIFEKLKNQPVTLFHIDIPHIGEYVADNGKPIQAIGGGSSVGLIAMSLAYTQGYRDMHLYGYDSSFMDDEGHAYAQDQKDEIIEAVVAGKTFQTTPWMVTQATQFQPLANQLRSLGCDVTVHGDGLLPHLAWAMMTQPETPPDTRAREILSRLPVGSVGAELGVFAGELSARLLLREDIGLYMVDSWIEHGDGKYAESGDFHATLTQAQQDNYMRMALSATEFAKSRRTVIRKDTKAAAGEIKGGSLDFVFIDADHSYEGCKADLDAWYPKLKDGGLLSGHDYNNKQCAGFGVTQAVDEFVEKHRLTLELGDNFTWFTRKADFPHP